MKVGIIGDGGLLGQALVQEIAGSSENKVFGLSTSNFKPTPYWNELKGQYEHQVLNLLKEEELFDSWLHKIRPDLVINCAALINIGDCEKSPDLAEELNAAIPEKIARQCKEIEAQFVYISTDQVFDGKKAIAYTEEDVVNPLHVYGKTKLSGENRVRKFNAQALIFRTNIVGFRDRPGQPTFAEWLINSFKERKEITLFDDYITNSMHVRLLSKLIMQFYEKKLSGLYNLASCKGFSKYKFGKELAEQLQLDFTNVKKGKVGDSSLIPRRPAYLELSTQKAEKDLGTKIPDLTETVQELQRDYKLRLQEAKHVHP